MTALATAVVGLLVGTATAAPAAITTSTLVGGFESSAEQWQAHSWGSNLVSAAFTEVAAADAPQGQQVAQVTQQVTGTGSAWTELWRDLPGLPFGKLTFKVRSADVPRVTVRLYDSSMETYSSTYDLTDTAGWQTITVDDPVTSGTHHAVFGGDGNKVWNGPMVRVGLVVEGGLRRDPSTTSATMEVDDVRVISPPSSLALDQSTVGNVFVGDAPASVDYRTTGDVLRWTVRDQDGVVADSGDATSVPATGSIPLDVGPGWYTLTVDALKDGAVTATRSTTFARIAGHTASAASPFGIAGGRSSAQAAPLAAQAGLGSVRGDETWQRIETSPGVYDWSAETWSDASVAAGMKPLVIADYGNTLYGGGNPTSSDAVAAYAAYAAAMARHFSGEAAGIELWNEWDLTTGNTPAGSPADYVALLRAAAPAVHAAAPGLPVIGPAVGLLSTSWLEQTFQLGALDYLDGIVLHPYSYPASAEALDATLTRVDALVRQYNGGTSLPLWITELGWPTGTAVRAVSETDQADDLTKSAAIATAHGVRAMTWYNLEDRGVDPADTEQNFGILHNTADPLGGLTPKPAYVAYATAASKLDGVTFAGRDRSIDGVWDLTYATAGGDQDLRVLWADRDRAVGIRSSVPFTVTTQYGASTTYPATGGATVVLQLSGEPVYVSGAIDPPVPDASALTVDHAYVGSPVAVHWTADNSGSPTAQTFTLTVDGLDQPAVQTVPAGTTGTVDLALPAPDSTGPLQVAGSLAVDGAARGMLRASAQVEEALVLTGTHTIDAGGAQTLRLRVVNRAPGAFTVEHVTWTVGGASGGSDASEQVAGGASVSIDVPLTALTAPAAWTATATVSGYHDLAASGAVRPVGDVTDAVKRTIDVDGTLDDLVGLPSVSLGRSTGGLDATVWFTWDDHALYVSAAVDDDVQYQQWTGADIWRGDSVQFTVAHGAPGEETRTYDEMGMALTPDGPQLHRWLPSDQAGQVPGATVAVTRDDTAGRTVYEASVPWAALGVWDPADGLLSASVAINENDGAGRSTAEWGGGIVSSKDSSLFNSVRLVLPEGWTSGAVYHAGDQVSYQGKVFKATWWTSGQIPGDVWGPWQELAVDANGATVWTPSRIFVAGDQVTHDGTHYVAQWWTRDQEPGSSTSGPWKPTT